MSFPDSPSSWPLRERYPADTAHTPEDGLLSQDVVSSELHPPPDAQLYSSRVAPPYSYYNPELYPSGNKNTDKREAVVMKVARTDAEGIYLPSIDSPVRSVATMSLFSLVHSRSQLGKFFKKPPATSLIGIDLLRLVRSGMKSPSTMLSLI
ncbi:hypothetical protein CPB85DRAFT_1449426 [Mucidula mucida]|nr:hypothetical protein CPB85DRAFT_1449426 [Mucidula mucida]